jgi:hypothetical protein
VQLSGFCDDIPGGFQPQAAMRATIMSTAINRCTPASLVTAPPRERLP